MSRAGLGSWKFSHGKPFQRSTIKSSSWQLQLACSLPPALMPSSTAACYVRPWKPHPRGPSALPAVLDQDLCLAAFMGLPRWFLLYFCTLLLWWHYLLFVLSSGLLQSPLLDGYPFLLSICYEIYFSSFACCAINKFTHLKPEVWLSTFILWTVQNK